MSAYRVEDKWDFYPCRVDDAPASISLNLWFQHNLTPAGADTIYWLWIKMLDAAAHGMGGPDEAAVLHGIEDEVTKRASADEFVFVGRLRSAGVWQLTFYGPANRLAALQKVVTASDPQDREIEMGSKPDPDWEYYREFLLPDAERQQWIQDRRVVDLLCEKGDPVRIPRRVDHWVYLPTAGSRDAFMRDATVEGFASQAVRDSAQGKVRFAARVHRIDAVELDHIHAVVMRLSEIAEQHGGEYDGWETSVAAQTN